MVIAVRDSKRIGVVWKSTLTRLNGEQLTGSTDNIAYSGINVIVPRELVVGEPLTMQLVNRCSGRLFCFNLEVAVVQIKPLEMSSGYSVGMRLINDNEAYQSFFLSLLEKQPQQRLA